MKKIGDFYITPENCASLLSKMVFESRGQNVLLGQDYEIAIRYGVYWLYTTSISSSSFEDSKTVLNSESLNMLFCRRNLSYWLILSTTLRHRMKLNNKTRPSLLTIFWRKFSSFRRQNFTKFLFRRTLTFTIDLFTYWTVKSCKKEFTSYAL